MYIVYLFSSYSLSLSFFFLFSPLLPPPSLRQSSSFLVTGSLDKTLKLWNTKPLVSLKRVTEVRSHTPSCVCVLVYCSHSITDQHVNTLYWSSSWEGIRGREEGGRKGRGEGGGRERERILWERDRQWRNGCPVQLWSTFLWLMKVILWNYVFTLISMNIVSYFCLRI